MDPQQIPVPQQEIELHDAVATLLNELPGPVQDFVLGPERNRVTLALSQKYNLHADQAGNFEHAFINMLLGASSPADFMQELTNAGIPQATAQGLAADINEQVFIPLRKAEQEGGSAPASQTAARPAPPLPAAPGTPPALVRPLPVAPATPVAPAMSTPATTSSPYPQTPLAAPQPYAPPPAFVPPAPAPVPPMVPPHPQHDYLRTMKEDMQIVHTLASRHVGPQAPAVPPQPIQPTSGPLGSEIAPPTPHVPPMPPAPRAPTPPNLPGTPLEKGYGSDPYREPIS